MSKSKVCPECGHEFKGNGWDGIDAHWKANHEKKMPYKTAWPLIESGQYKPRAGERRKREDVNQAAFRVVRESTEDR